MPTNVVRFPAELRARPTLELMRTLAPGIGDVLAGRLGVGCDRVGILGKCAAVLVRQVVRGNRLRLVRMVG